MHDCTVKVGLCNKGKPHYKKCGVIYDTMEGQSQVISTPTVSYDTSLVWYVQFVFYSAISLAIITLMFINNISDIPAVGYMGGS